MLPVTPAISSRAFYEKLFSALEVKPKLQIISPIMLAVLGVFIPTLRELREMNYEWEHDFVVSDAPFREHLGFGATDLVEALRATAGWAIRTYAPRALTPHRTGGSSIA